MQDGPEHSTLRVSGMIMEVHEEEDADTSAGVAVEENPSPSPVVGEEIVPVGGTLVALQDVPKHQLIQGMQKFPPHIISAHQMEICGAMPSGKLHDQGLDHIVYLE